MPLFADRVMETSVTTGTGTLTLAGAVTGFRTFTTKHITGELVSYAIEEVTAGGNPAGAWEIGFGTLVTATTLSRLVVMESSNAGALVNFTGNLRVWSNQNAFLGSDGFATSQAGAWMPAGGSATAPAVFGFPAFTAIIAGTARTPAVTNRLTRAKRIGYVTAATAGLLAGLSMTTSGAQSQTIGAGTAGGFMVRLRWGCSDPAAVAGARMFVGMRNSTAAPVGNVEPNTATNAFGVAQLSTSTNLFLMWGGSAAQTSVDLGANFPASGLSTDLYELLLFSPASPANVVLYNIQRVGTTFASSGLFPNATPGTTLPLNTTYLAPALWRANNATALAVGIDVAGASGYLDF
jgi:hypothetical protein